MLATGRRVQTRKITVQQLSQPMNDVSSRYLGDKGKEYFAKFTEDRVFVRIYQLRYFRPHVNNTMTVIDFGSNDGLMLRELKVGDRIGIEVNPTAREKCAELNESTGTSVKVFSSLDAVEDEIADAIISNHTLEHVPNPLHVLGELNRMLKPGGKLILVTPFDDWRNQVHHAWSENDLDNHLHTWSPRNLGNLVTEAGLQVESSVAHEIAVSKRFRPLFNWFGDGLFQFVCRLFGRYKKKAEIHLVASKPTIS